MLYLLSERIKELRISQGYSQVDFAKRIGVTKQCVSNWENDNIVPSVEMLIKIADIFHVTTDYLIGRTKDVYIEANGLTPEQISHLSSIIKDLKNANLTKQK